MPLDNHLVRKFAKEALWEDAAFEDITTLSFIPQEAIAEACIVAKEPGILCGTAIAEAAFKIFDPSTAVRIKKHDAAVIRNGDAVIRLKGRARSILSCERVALNFISYLSGISSQAGEASRIVRSKGIRILDTRKTTPHLRVLEKYAVLTGGGKNHRLDLSDQYLVKENHLDVLSGTCGREVLLWRKKNMAFEIEVRDFAELRMALSVEPDIVMLDNFSPSEIKRAVVFLKKIFPDKNKRPLLELSGGISLKNLAQYAISGVDFISLGSLTHSARALDFSLDITKVYSR